MEITHSSIQGTYLNKRVLVTGDTGFKGSWLCEWLLLEGADVFGLGLEPNTTPSLFKQLKLSERIKHQNLDIRNYDKLASYISSVQPQFIFHLAAQPLVRYSYQHPVETFATNVLGTVNLLDALKVINHKCVAVLITTDKCYENKEWVYSYRECDSLGGYDPYSASKGCCEIAINSYRNSYYKYPLKCGKAVASARAGNVVGGGDWSLDRIIPDCIRNIKAGNPIPVRNKTATRPWQHVLEPLSGYLLLAAELWACLASKIDGENLTRISTLNGPFNFGPELYSNKTVEALVKELLKHCSGTWVDQSDPKAPHEASLLNLSIDKSYHTLGWRPKWNFERTILETVNWYNGIETNKSNATEMTQRQIRQYLEND